MSSGIDSQAESTPRFVSRGVKLQAVFIGIDSLYVVLEYPKRDIFDFWSAPIQDFSHPQLHEGIVYEGMLLRRGSLGYKLSVWDGDARLFLTDRVNAELVETPAEGQGMGIMLQLGTKWLRLYGDVLAPNGLIQNVLGQFSLFGVVCPDQYLARLNRLDVTVDIAGLDVGAFSLEDWRQQWVGYALRKAFHDSAQTGRLEGLSIGSSEGAVRFKVYDKVAESLKRGTTAFWHSVWGLDTSEELPVARFEWSVKCYEASFIHLRYLHEFTYLGFLELLNYVTLKWGRLCLPDPNDSNKSRWPHAPLWAALRQMIEDWQFSYTATAKREYHLKPDISLTYLRSLAGYLAGLQARVGIEHGASEPSSLEASLQFLQEQGYSTAYIASKAKKKWEVISKLSSVGTQESKDDQKDK